MLIGIDGNEANTKKRVGIGAYAYAVISGIAKYKKDNTKLVIYLKNNPIDDMPEPTEAVSYEIVKPTMLWTQIGLPITLFTQKRTLDVFFSPSHYAPRFSPVPTVISIMDLSFLHFPKTFAKKDLVQLKNWTSYSVKNAKRVITISQASKDDILKAYKVPSTRVAVTYPGIRDIVSLTPNVYPKTMLENTYGISGKYFLFVGTLQPRKNIVKLIEAFSILSNQKSMNNKEKMQLVIVGKRGWKYEGILAAPAKFGVEDEVTFLEFVDDEDLPALYKHAVSYVLPSLYEGFGLPVLEAMKYECPVITSNVSSLPEAGGDGALYVDPEDATDIAKKMKMVLDDTSLRKSLIEKGKKHVTKFSWDKTARETLSVLEEVAERK